MSFLLDGLHKELIPPKQRKELTDKSQVKSSAAVDDTKYVQDNKRHHSQNKETEEENDDSENGERNPETAGDSGHSSEGEECSKSMDDPLVTEKRPLSAPVEVVDKPSLDKSGDICNSTSEPMTEESNLQQDINNGVAANFAESQEPNAADAALTTESIISLLFDGEIISTVRCLTCQHISSTKENFQVFQHYIK